jgi:hypothetical protein
LEPKFQLFLSAHPLAATGGSSNHQTRLNFAAVLMDNVEADRAEAALIIRDSFTSREPECDRCRGLCDIIEGSFFFSSGDSETPGFPDSTERISSS